MPRKIECDFRNEKNGNCKLKDEQIQQLKDLISEATYTYRQLGEMFRCSHTHVRRVAIGISRK